MKTILSIFLVCLSLLVHSQELSEKQSKKMMAMEKALVPFVNDFANDSLKFEARVQKIHEFIPRFVTTLKEKNSFQYPFDSLLYISKVIAPDNTFKIFTWQLKEPLGTHRYYGVIQFNSEDLKIKPLFDFSDTLLYQTQQVLTPNNWYGCMYYNCVLTQNKKGEKYYTLFGLDNADFVSNRKVLEIMQIKENDEVVFGAEPLIEYYDSLGIFVENKHRLYLEYTDKAVIGLNYKADEKLIVFDHITPPSEREKDAKFTYIPDGTYEGFEWKNGKWLWKERVYNYSINKPDSPPMPAPKNNGSKKNILGK